MGEYLLPWGNTAWFVWNCQTLSARHFGGTGKFSDMDLASIGVDTRDTGCVCYLILLCMLLWFIEMAYLCFYCLNIPQNTKIYTINVTWRVTSRFRIESEAYYPIYTALCNLMLCLTGHDNCYTGVGTKRKRARVCVCGGGGVCVCVWDVYVCVCGGGCMRACGVVCECVGGCMCVCVCGGGG